MGVTLSVLGGVRHLTLDVLRTSLAAGPAGAMIMSEIVMAEREDPGIPGCCQFRGWGSQGLACLAPHGTSHRVSAYVNALGCQ